MDTRIVAVGGPTGSGKTAMTIERIQVSLPRKSGTYKIMLRPGKFYDVGYRTHAPERSKALSWLANARYVGYTDEKAVFEIPGGYLRRVRLDKFVELSLTAGQPLIDREELLDKLRERREGSREDDADRIAIRERTLQWVAERRTVRREIQELVESQDDGNR